MRSSSPVATLGVLPQIRWSLPTHFQRVELQPRSSAPCAAIVRRVPWTVDLIHVMVKDSLVTRLRVMVRAVNEQLSGGANVASLLVFGGRDKRFGPCQAFATMSSEWKTIGTRKRVVTL